MTSTEIKPNICLSKTLFMKGLQCHKALYLQKYHPELRSELDAETKHRFAGGHEAGGYAKELFPGGIEVPFDGLTYDAQVAMTQTELAKGTKTIYEATFSFDDVFVKLDILHKGSKGLEMYEVKAVNEMKEHHLDDISIQYFVATRAGIPIKKAHIVYMNREYVRKGAIDPNQLFIIEDITKQVKDNQDAIEDSLGELKNMLHGSMPQIDIGVHCSDPYECDFMEHCWKHLPETSVFNLCGSSKIKWELYYDGHHDMAKIPLERLEQKQRFQVEAFINEAVIVNKIVVRQFLNSLTYPLCFFDFETFQQSVPPVDGTKPYQKIPFQYSLHVIKKEGAKPKHYEYLAESGQDPREAIAAGLIEQIPADATVFAYHKAFEIGIMKNLKEWFPKLAKRLDTIQGAIFTKGSISLEDAGFGIAKKGSACFYPCYDV